MKKKLAISGILLLLLRLRCRPLPRENHCVHLRNPFSDIERLFRDCWQIRCCWYRPVPETRCSTPRKLVAGAFGKTVRVPLFQKALRISQKTVLVLTKKTTLRNTFACSSFVLLESRCGNSRRHIAGTPGNSFAHPRKLVAGSHGNTLRPLLFSKGLADC